MQTLLILLGTSPQTKVGEMKQNRTEINRIVKIVAITIQERMDVLPVFCLHMQSKFLILKIQNTNIGFFKLLTSFIPGIICNFWHMYKKSGCIQFTCWARTLDINWLPDSRYYSEWYI